MSILVIDVGSSGVRSSVVRPDATLTGYHHQVVRPSTPGAGVVELDGIALADAVLATARAALAEAGPVAAVGITAQRASTIVWDRATGVPVGPGIGWQDLRTVGPCLVAQGKGVRVGPNQSATKVVFLLDAADPRRTRDLCAGTIDTWVAWVLSEGALHVTDPSNAGVTGLVDAQADDWDPAVLDVIGVPRSVLGDIVDSSGVVGVASALDGAPPIAGIVGDQQGSLIGQRCVLPGMAKITFGTGAMLDVCVGEDRPPWERRGPHGTFPIVAWRDRHRQVWGVEAIALAAGTAVDWLVDLGVLADAAESGPVAEGCDDSDGAYFVPALAGLGTPEWDYGARGTLVGVSAGTSRARLVRAVLEGIAHQGADLVDAAEADTGSTFESLRVDGGMTANTTFLQALANATHRPVEVSPEREATTLGAAFLAGLAVGTWSDWDDVASTWAPATVVEPTGRLDRARWRTAVERSRRWVPTLSALDL